MRGAQELIASRLKGHAPPMVFVDLDFQKLPAMEGHIQIEAEDRLSALDLRGVFGLVVSVSGMDSTKTRDIAAACADAGALRVIATISDASGVMEVTDTDGVLSWKK